MAITIPRKYLPMRDTLSDGERYTVRNTSATEELEIIDDVWKTIGILLPGEEITYKVKVVKVWESVYDYKT